jgi:hypothetical protein
VRATRTSRTILRIAYDRWVRNLRAVGVCAVLSACAPDGLTLEVTVESDTERVEVFVGRNCGSECPSEVIVPDIGTRSVSNAYLMKDARPWTTDRADFSDGKAGFRLEVSQDEYLGIVVIVGYNAQGQVTGSRTFHDVEVPAGEAKHWEVTLAATAPLGPTVSTQPPGTETIKMWQGPSKTLAACVFMEHWDDSSQPVRDLIVPYDDTDCDEIAETAECAPWTANASGAPPSIDDASCVTFKTSGGSNLCVIGGPQCFENGGTGENCVPLAEDYCAPSKLCLCADSTTPLDCLRGAIADGSATSAVPYVKCAIPLDDSGVPCNGQTHYEIDAQTYLGTTTTKCEDIRLGHLRLPVGTLDHSIELAPDSAAYLKVETFYTPCKADLAWGGSAPSPVSPQFGFVDLVLDNGRHLAIPMKIDLSVGCDGRVATCGFVRPADTSDPIWSCLAPATTPPMFDVCPVQADCLYGVLCNGLCCGRGERCGANGCECGTTGQACGAGDTCQSATGYPDQCGTACCGVSPCPF